MLSQQRALHQCHNALWVCTRSPTPARTTHCAFSENTFRNLRRTCCKALATWLMITCRLAAAIIGDHDNTHRPPGAQNCAHKLRRKRARRAAMTCRLAEYSSVLECTRSLNALSRESKLHRVGPIMKKFLKSESQPVLCQSWSHIEFPRNYLARFPAILENSTSSPPATVWWYHALFTMMKLKHLESALSQVFSKHDPLYDWYSSLPNEYEFVHAGGDLRSRAG